MGVTGRPRAATPYFPVVYGFLSCRKAVTTGRHSTGRSMAIGVGERRTVMCSFRMILEGDETPCFPVLF